LLALCSGRLLALCSERLLALCSERLLALCSERLLALRPERLPALCAGRLLALCVERLPALGAGRLLALCVERLLALCVLLLPERLLALCRFAGLPLSAIVLVLLCQQLAGRARRVLFGDAREQIVRAPRVVGVAHEAGVAIELQLEQFAAQARVVVAEALGLLGDALRHPGDAPDGRERKRDQACEQSHRQAASTGSSTKL
jgi:hypothetical protein